MRKEYEDYSLSLALFDSVPVVLFLLNCIAIYPHFRSVLFLIGAIATFFGGMSKVIWKLIVVTKKKDVSVLIKVFRILMFGGFGIIVVSVIVGCFSGACAGFVSGFTSMPSMIFFLIGIAGMSTMVYFAKHMDKSAKSNWMEEVTNATSQAAFLIGLLIMK